MLGRLLNRIFGRAGATPSPTTSRPASRPPAVPAVVPPPPPPPPPGVTAAPGDPAPAREAKSAVDAPEPGPARLPAAARSAPAEGGSKQQLVEEAPPVTEEQEAGRVRLILEDGTLARPSLDPELEERLRYIVDNIVPPSEGPST